MRTAKIEIMICDEKHVFDTDDELIIDQHDLDGELSQQAARYAYIAVLHERAKDHLRELEAEKQELDARLDGVVRDAMTKAEEKITEAKVLSRIKLRPERKALKRKIRRAEQSAGTLLSLVMAYAQRKDLIVSLARSRGVEMSSMSPAEFAKTKDRLMKRRRGD